MWFLFPAELPAVNSAEIETTPVFKCAQVCDPAKVAE